MRSFLMMTIAAAIASACADPPSSAGPRARAPDASAHFEDSGIVLDAGLIDAAVAVDAVVSVGDAALDAAVDAAVAGDAVVLDADVIAPADAGANDNGFVQAPDYVPAGGLCAIPADYIANGGDPTYIPCEAQVEHLSDRDPSVVPAELTVVDWNIEFGKHAADIEDSLATNPALANADFYFFQEVARNNLESDPQLIDQARQLATRLAMNYVFAVEWDRRIDPMQQGEHGVAILSKYPLGEITQLRHTPLNDWYGEDMLYGGRITLGVTANVGGTLLRLYSSHLCTRGGEDGRAMQGAELRVEADRPGLPIRQLAGGDLNTWTCNPLVVQCNQPPSAERIIQEFLSRWSDGHPDFNGWTQLGSGFFPQRLDWIFYRGVSRTASEAVQDANGSDHRPLVLRFSL